MKNLYPLLVGLLLLSCQETSPPVVQSEMFGEGIISSEAPEFSTALSPDEREVIFNRTAPDRSSMWLMSSTFEGGKWTTPDSLPFTDVTYRDIDPFFSTNGHRLYFSSDRPVDSLNSNNGEFNSWYVERLASGWSAPLLLDPPLNSDSTEIFISLSEAGNAYFVSERGDVRGIMVCTYENGVYQDARYLNLRLRGELVYASNPCIAPDESFIIVAVRDPEGPGTPDLFVSFNEAGNWSELINLGPIVNSPYAEFAPGLSKDQQYLFFTSERPGMLPAQEEGIRPPGDIYRVDIQAVLSGLDH